MTIRIRRYAWLAAFILAAAVVFPQQPQGTMTFTVSMEQPANHLFHVVFRCEGLKGPSQEFKMPAWSPGYYSIRDFARNVQNFRAEDGTGKELAWEKVANAWKVQSGTATAVKITYDVSATSSFVADPYLGEDRGYIVGTGVFMYVAGRVAHPVTVDIKLNPNWKSVASGLEPVSPDKPTTLVAPDFDALYDSPILIGNLDSLPPFEIKGVPHYFTGFKLGSNFDAQLFMKNLKAVVEQGIAVIGEIPYTHYTFLGIGSGAGGIEHLNSTTVPFTGSPALDTHAGALRTLNFLAHEYFHNYNVKRIRPVALGPFDYDKANLTNMLWVSEGFTSYYEYVMVARAGLMTREELLGSYQREIAAFENSTGRLFQSATQASYETWNQGPFGGRGRAGVVKSISYYNKGAALGLLLDFKIRHETNNRKSLDTVMQTLYQKYYKGLKRGWTDEEFRAVCESTAGGSLKEIFEYAATTREIDYNKYLGYAGLQLENPAEMPDAYLGAVVEDLEGRTVISALEEGSPAQKAGMAAKDVITALDGSKVDAAGLTKLVAAKKPGEQVSITITRAGAERQFPVTLAHRMQRTFKIVPIAGPDSLQTAILQDWMKPRQLR
jgi:predicted metalloprotease with PDZ domain